MADVRWQMACNGSAMADGGARAVAVGRGGGPWSSALCPKSKVKGAKSTYYKFCANPPRFHVNGRHFCGVHKFTFQNHPGALKE
jgi:hypothetical protein